MNDKRGTKSGHEVRWSAWLGGVPFGAMDNSNERICHSFLFRSVIWVWSRIRARKKSVHQVISNALICFLAQAAIISASTVELHASRPCDVWSYSGALLNNREPGRAVESVKIVGVLQFGENDQYLRPKLATTINPSVEEPDKSGNYGPENSEGDFFHYLILGVVVGLLVTFSGSSGGALITAIASVAEYGVRVISPPNDKSSPTPPTASDGSRENMK